MKKKLKVVETPKLLKLDLGCGKNKRQGFHGVDSLKFDGVDTVLNLVEPHEHHPFSFKPWPWENDSVEEVYCSHFLEHLSQIERVHFFNELWRVMIKDSKGMFIVPSWTSERAYGDPTHKWPPVTGFSFLYLNKEWREVNAPHVGYTCNFTFQGGNSIAHPWSLRSQEVQLMAQNHYVNVAQDMWVTITCLK